MNVPSSALHRAGVLRAFALALALAAAAPLAAQEAIPGLDAAGMDRSVRPGDDFYRYANGAWDRQTPIPGDRSSVSGWAVAARRAEEQLTALVQGAAAARAPAGSDLRRIGDFYTAFLDTAAIARGMAPLRPLLARIEAIGDRQALARFIGETLRADVDVINEGDLFTDNVFGLWVDQDFNQPTRNSAALLQGGLKGDQQFFLSFAQTWRARYREPLLRRLLLTDGHSPAPFRALTVRNLDAWYDAFAVRPGEALYLAPADRVRIW